MKKHTVILSMLIIMLSLALCACQNSEQKQTEVINLQERYEQGIASLNDTSADPPVLFPETNIDYFEAFYPGIGAIEMKQFYAGVAPVTNAPFEVILVEVANADDVQEMIDIFQNRADRASKDEAYPENAAAWLNEVKITSRDNYVFLAVLMNNKVPAEFILD
ncbi:MAG: DUF4358 domain-containing protein [Peptococcaceae bacterium]|nr:DUF4358 domain-containing protein [Peptococcaceae bacterium]